MNTQNKSSLSCQIAHAMIASGRVATMSEGLSLAWRQIRGQKASKSAIAREWLKANSKRFDSISKAREAFQSETKVSLHYSRFNALWNM